VGFGGTISWAKRLLVLLRSSRKGALDGLDINGCGAEFGDG
jgi:hypothetical protein